MDARRELRKERRLAVLLIVAPLLFDALMFWVVRSDFEASKRSQRSLSWPSVPGTIVSSSYDSPRGGKMSRSCRAWFRYRYEVGGRKWVSTTSRSRGSCRALQDEVAVHPPGRAVSVYYDPNDPADTVLEPRAFEVSWGMDIFIGVLSVVASFPFMFVGLALLDWLPLPRMNRQVARAKDRAKKKNVERRRKRRKLI